MVHLRALHGFAVVGLLVLGACDGGADFDNDAVLRNAQTFLVTSTNDAALHPSAAPCECKSTERNGKCTLRAAVQAANACEGHDTIILAKPGIYGLDIYSPSTGDVGAAEGDLDITDAVTIRAQLEPFVSATVQANFLTGKEHRLFDVHPTAEFARFESFRMKGGLMDPNVWGPDANGGCLRTTESDTTLHSMVVGGEPDDGCQGWFGGAIFAQGGRLALQSTIVGGGTSLHFAGQNTSGSGGGVASSGAETSIEGSTLIGNESIEYGGGLYTNGGSVTVVDTDILENLATNEGGGAYLASPFFVKESVVTYNEVIDGSSMGGGGLLLQHSSSDNALVLDTEVAHNVANRGGGITVDGAAVILRSDVHNNETMGNEATAEGGGVLAWTGAGVRFDESSLHSNRSAFGGGLFVAAGAEVSATNSTIADNEATDDGGGAFVDGVLSLLHATVRRNVAADLAGGIFSSGSTKLDRSILFENSESAGPPDCDGSVTSVGFSMLDAASCASGAASDVDGSAAGWGVAGYHAPGNTYSIPLLTDNVGLSVVEECGVDADQRGVGRDTVCDIGAYEGPEV